MLAAVGRGPEWKAEIGVRANHCPGWRPVLSAALRLPLLVPDQSRVKGGNDTTLWVPDLESAENTVASLSSTMGKVIGFEILQENLQ
ncbi:hypothetical protein E2C01_063704 [Portunus trituberculatus]|uniref:Uncharacterized protein n=1 Tax=Portunus trituberculatus TaxID=210409 RepID=A0A5B7HL85_PORTR|nr:hypothetical protein [Portunus trituberculatus]